MKIPLSWKKRSRSRRRTIEFSLRIRHPKPRLDSGIPGTMKHLVTADLPDIPASEHRRQNLDASRLRAREFRGRRSTAGRQTGIGVSPSSFDGWNKKMGGALDVPGPDLSLRRGEPRPDLRSVGPFPSSCSFGPLSSPRVSPLARPSTEEERGEEWKGRQRGQVDENGQPLAACAATHDRNIKRSCYTDPDKGSRCCCCWRCCRHRLRWSSNKVMGFARTRLSLLGCPGAVDRAGVSISPGEGHRAVLQRRVS